MSGKTARPTGGGDMREDLASSYRSDWVPTTSSVRVVLGIPAIASTLCLTWAVLAHLVLTQGAVTAEYIQRLNFWAADLPLFLFGVPATTVWLCATGVSLFRRQVWQALVVTLYNLGLLLLTGVLLPMLVPIGIGDL